MKKSNRKPKEGQLESLAKFVHGSLFAFHTLGVIYNLRKRRYVNVVVHAGVATYDLLSAIRHSKGERYLDMDKIREGL